MLQFDVEIRKNRLGNLVPAVRREVAKFIQQHAEATALDAQRRAPVGKKPHVVGGELVQPGYLRSRITAEVLGELEAEVRSEAPYSLFVDQGTRFMAGTFFFSAALDQAEARWYPGLAAAIRRGLEDGAK